MIRFSLDKSKSGIEVSKHLYGLFFEDINQAGDGGLNAEIVINNSFEFEYFAYDNFNASSPRHFANRRPLIGIFRAPARTMSPKRAALRPPILPI